MNQGHFFDMMNRPGPAPARPVFTIAAPPEAKPWTPLHFYRCPECLTVICTREELPRMNERPYDSDRAAALCACGNQWVEYMGRAGKQRLEKDAKACPCDARCTAARGPQCDCQCGGKNHGSNLLVDVIVDAGPIPVLKMLMVETAKYNRLQWTEAQRLAMVRIARQHGPQTLEAFKARQTLPWATAALIRSQLATLAKAKDMRTKARLTTLAGIAKGF